MKLASATNELSLKARPISGLSCFLSVMNIAPKHPSPTGLVILSIVSVQLGSALAKSLFSELGMWGVVSLRVGLSTVILFALWRLKWHSQIRQNLKTIIAFGVVFALMNT